MELGQIFRDGLIFQRGKPIRIFGRSEDGVSVAFRGTERRLPGGAFLAEFPAEEYGGPYTLTISGDGTQIELRDIYVGEVILFSGQSNIQFRMDETGTGGPYPADDRLRIFVSERPEAGEPLHPSDGWVSAGEETIGSWSAVAYLTGRALRRYGIPAVGVVVCSQGASVIQSWIDERIFTGSALDIPNEKRHRPLPDKDYPWNENGMLFHFMLEPLFPFSFGTVVWYQGESNSSVAEGECYDRLLDMMIRNWRNRFAAPELGFLVVQIADFTDPNIDQAGWKAVQAAQLRAADWIPGVVTVISADVCENNMIHPVTKDKLADRIAAGIRQGCRVPG